MFGSHRCEGIQFLYLYHALPLYAVHAILFLFCPVVQRTVRLGLTKLEVCRGGVFACATEIIMCYILPGKKFMRDEDSN